MLELKLNDRVFCTFNEWGTVIELDTENDWLYPITVRYDNGYIEVLPIEGKESITALHRKRDIKLIVYFNSYKEAYIAFQNQYLKTGKKPTNFGIVNHLGEHEMLEDWLEGMENRKDITYFRKDT